MADISGIYYQYDDAPLEAATSRNLIDRLSFHFDVHEQVYGKHYSGKTFRLDAVICPKDKMSWKNPHTAIGIEIKRGVKSWSEQTKLIAQSVDYAMTEWNGFGYLDIYAYPDPLEHIRGSTKHHFDVGFYERVFGQNGVGFVVDRNGYIELQRAGDVIWSEATGVDKGRFCKCERKFGSK